jgi:putative ABC transport system substrate-binding protein
MRRRPTLLIAGLVLGLLTVPLVSGARPSPKMLRVGILGQGLPPADLASTPLVQGLHDLGWVEGQSIRFMARYAHGQDDRLPALAAELVREGVDVLFAVSTPAAIAARQATSTIPIVFVFVNDPIASGLAVSLSRPGSNATGVTTLQPDLARKMLQLFREALPNLVRVGVLWNPNNPGKVAEFREVEAAASILGVGIQSLEVRAPAEIEPALKALRTDRPTGVLVLSDGVTGFSNLRYTAEVVGRTRLPAIYPFRNYVDLGGLMSYGTSGTAMVRQAAKHVDRVLRGERPADLPIEQPTTFELVINMKTAKALGVTIAPAVMLRVDRIIE